MTDLCSKKLTIEDLTMKSTEGGNKVRQGQNRKNKLLNCLRMTTRSVPELRSISEKLDVELYLKEERHFINVGKAVPSNRWEFLKRIGDLEVVDGDGGGRGPKAPGRATIEKEREKGEKSYGDL